jgi:hypothetical protein
MLVNQIRRAGAVLGPFRVALTFAAAGVIFCAPFAFGETHYHDWRIITTVVAPIMMVMLAFLLPLDMLMTRVFMAGSCATTIARLRKVMVAEVMVLVALIGAWMPFILDLFNS